MHRVVRNVLRVSIFAVAAVGVAAAAPRETARDKYRAAAKLAMDDDNEKALALVDEGLKLAPRDLELLQLKGVLHLKMRDYSAALAAYQAYLDAGAQGANRREATKIVKNLAAVKTTFLEIDGTERATIYLDAKSYGALCTSPCKQSMLPGDYKVIAERTGFDRWTGRVTVDQGKTAKVTLALVEKASLVTVRGVPAGARVTLDGKPHDAPGNVAPGKHQIEVVLAGHATSRVEIHAKEGAPIDVDITLVPLVPVSVEPATATLALDDKPLAIDAGGLAIPAGAHTLTARAPGFHDARVEIPADRPAGYKLVVELAPIGSMLELTGVPSGAAILVDGKPAGTTPLAKPLEIAPGRHSIELRVSGYRPYRATGTFAADQRARLEGGKLVRDNRKRTYIAGAVTGVAALVGTVFSFGALSKESDYNARARQAGVTPDDPMLRDLRDSGRGASRVADVGFGLALVGLGVTTYFFLTEGRGESKGSLRIGIGPAGAVASGRF